MPQSVADALADHESLCLRLCGADSGVAAQALEQAVACTLGHEVKEIDYARGGFGLVLRARLGDQQRVIMKLLGRTRAALQLLLAARERMRAQGLPAPVVLAGPVAVGRAQLIVEAFDDPAGMPDARSELGRTAIAAGLARFVRAGRAAGVEGCGPGWFSGLGTEQLWPRLPHLRLHEQGEPSARRIDGYAVRARNMRREQDHTRGLGHFDWRAEHLRFGANGELLQIYDWDSVHGDLEPVVLGAAAHAFGFAADSQAPWLPDVQSMRSFRDAYEHARGQTLTTTDRALAGAAAVYALAFSARAELASAESRSRRPFSASLDASADELLARGL